MYIMPFTWSRLIHKLLEWEGKHPLEVLYPWRKKLVILSLICDFTWLKLITFFTLHYWRVVYTQDNRGNCRVAIKPNKVYSPDIVIKKNDFKTQLSLFLSHLQLYLIYLFLLVIFQSNGNVQINYNTSTQENMTKKTIFWWIIIQSHYYSVFAKYSKRRSLKNYSTFISDTRAEITLPKIAASLGRIFLSMCT